MLRAVLQARWEDQNLPWAVQAKASAQLEGAPFERPEEDDSRGALHPGIGMLSGFGVLVHLDRVPGEKHIALLEGHAEELVEGHDQARLTRPGFARAVSGRSGPEALPPALNRLPGGARKGVGCEQPLRSVYHVLDHL